VFIAIPVYLMNGAYPAGRINVLHAEKSCLKKVHTITGYFLKKKKDKKI
jgi:hypothetical protein